MAQTPSTFLLPLGEPAPAFRLPDPSARVHTLDDFAGRRALVVMFICNHCPFVKHIRAELARLARDYQPREVGFVAINSNDVTAYPDDSPARMADEARDAGYTFPYLFDESQEVAKAYKASCTPDFFAFDAERHLAYRGQLDDSRPPSKSGGNTIPVSGADLRAALDAILERKPVTRPMKPSIGCNIKWKPGNQPAYVTA